MASPMLPELGESVEMPIFSLTPFREIKLIIVVLHAFAFLRIISSSSKKKRIVYIKHCETTPSSKSETQIKHTLVPLVKRTLG